MLGIILLCVDLEQLKGDPDPIDRYLGQMSVGLRVAPGIHPARLIRSRRAHLLAAVLPLTVVLAGCTVGSGSRSTAAPSSTAPFITVASDCLPPSGSCYLPYLFRAAYGIQPLLNAGIDGRGETVTVVDPAPGPGNVPPGLSPNGSDIRQDLATFDSEFRLPAAQIKVVTTLAGSASPWQASAFEVQDLEIVHVVAPAATLRVVLVPSSTLSPAYPGPFRVQVSVVAMAKDMIAGLRLAVSGTDVASIGFGLGEHFFTAAQVAQLHSILMTADADHVTVVAGSGDNGGFGDTPPAGTPVKEVDLPAGDPLVLAVGGTTLTANPVAGAYIGETVWNETGSFAQSIPEASGGGFSHLYARPAYQDGVPGIGAMRGVPDVAGDADPQAGLSLVYVSGGQRWIVSSGGTEASAPLWAGLMALADQDAHHDLGFVNPAIYGIARGSSYHKAFHDITTGNNILHMSYLIGTAGYQAGPGWDPATGWGSPDAQVLVPLLARSTRSFVS